MSENIDRIRQIKTKLRICNMICDDCELFLNHSQKGEEKALNLFMQLNSAIDDMKKILEKGD
jgi:hypothetical protein